MLGFEHGGASALDGERLDPVALIEQWRPRRDDSVSAAASTSATPSSASTAGSRSKAPAAEIIPDRTASFEKLVLSARRHARMKDHAGPRRAATWCTGPAPRPGLPRHRGVPPCRPRRASRARSSCFRVRARCSSRASPAMVADGPRVAPTAKSAGEWTPAEAHGFSKMLALPGIFYTRRRAGAGGE